MYVVLLEKVDLSVDLSGLGRYEEGTKKKKQELMKAIPAITFAYVSVI